MILGHKMKLLIPNRDSLGRSISNQSVIQYLSKLFLRHFGGATLWPCHGIYHTDTGQLIEEDNITLDSSFDSDKLPELADVLLEAAQLLFNHLNQEAMAVEIDGKLLIISRNSLPPASLQIQKPKPTGPGNGIPKGFHCRIGRKWYLDNHEGGAQYA